MESRESRQAFQVVFAIGALLVLPPTLTLRLCPSSTATSDARMSGHRRRSLLSLDHSFGQPLEPFPDGGPAVGAEFFACPPVRRNVGRMTLQERVDADLKESMRAKDAPRLGVLRMLKSAFKYSAIEKSSAENPLDDAEATQVIRKQVKQRQDSIESFEKGGRPELAQKEKEELAMLSAYLPQAMGEAELAQMVRDAIAEVGATSRAQMGMVMKALQTRVAGRADGKTLSQEVQRQLG